MSTKTYDLYAKRNSATLECASLTYEQWLAQSSSLLENGFMVLVREGLWVTLNQYEEISLVREEEIGGVQ